MYKNISINKNEYNVRRVDELNVELLEKEKELENTVGFFNRLKVKNDIRKITKLLNTHGSEVLEFEYLNQNRIN
ncbi:MAG: hypothetical protein RBQ97_09390 [Acholeplasma sp.]|nr:hypothetical protein [Acholeplasma sp.]